MFARRLCYIGCTSIILCIRSGHSSSSLVYPGVVFWVVNILWHLPAKVCVHRLQ